MSQLRVSNIRISEMERNEPNEKVVPDSSKRLKAINTNYEPVETVGVTKLTYSGDRRLNFLLLFCSMKCLFYCTLLFIIKRKRITCLSGM